MLVQYNRWHHTNKNAHRNACTVQQVAPHQHPHTPLYHSIHSIITRTKLVWAQQYQPNTQPGHFNMYPFMPFVNIWVIERIYLLKYVYLVTYIRQEYVRSVCSNAWYCLAAPVTRSPNRQQEQDDAVKYDFEFFIAPFLSACKIQVSHPQRSQMTRYLYWGESLSRRSRGQPTRSTTCWLACRHLVLNNHISGGRIPTATMW